MDRWADTAKAGEEQIKKFEEQTGIKVNQTNFTYDMLHEKILTAGSRRKCAGPYLGAARVYR